MPPPQIPDSLLLFTTSSTPLAPRYPTPKAARPLLIPPLLHASLHLAVDRQTPSYTLTDEGVLMIPNPEDRIDEIDGHRSAADEEGVGMGTGVNADSEITVKFHIIADSPVSDRGGSDGVADDPTSVQRQKAQISRALRNLEHYKALDPRWRGERARKGIDTFLIGWKGVEYRGEKRPAEEAVNGQGVVDSAVKAVKKVVGSAKLMSKLTADAEKEEALRLDRLRRQGWLLTDGQKREIAEVWADLPNLVPQAKKLGTLSLPLPLLQYLGTTPPSASTAGSTSRPTFNSRPSDAGVRSVRRSLELEREYQEKLEQEGPGADVKSDVVAHETAFTETDKSLLAELIPNPPESSATTPPSEAVTSDTPVAEDAREAPGVTRKLARSLPAVNCMDTPDCHWLPEDLLRYAEDNGIELWAGGVGESSDPLPSAHLHNTLQEFVTKLPLGLFKSDTTLAQLVSLEEGGVDGQATQAGVEVEWVLGYTVISKSRNVVQDKGYIISAAVL